VATTLLKLFNGALRMLKERPLVATSDAREPARILSAIWADDALNRCLEMGRWKFATRTVELEYSPSVEPTFGYQRAFDKPTDFIRTSAICSDEYFRAPLLEYSDEAGFWFCDLDTIYVKYVSNDASYGADYSLWPGNFAEFVSGYLAEKAAPALVRSAADQEELLKRRERLLAAALSTDAMAGPTQFQPHGSWTGARGHGRTTGRGPDR
jgi:hypothetical protein